MKVSQREMLAGLATCGCALVTREQERTGIDRSLYIPKAQHVEDRILLHDFMDDHIFVELIPAAPTLKVTHIPVLLDRDQHIARVEGMW